MNHIPWHNSEGSVIFHGQTEVQWTLINMKKTDITKSRCNKDIFLVSKLNISVYCIRHIYFASLIFRESGLQDISASG